ncbi:MAG: hypothetical protein ACTHMJ_13395 [Thermomicrobiales bacterium]
MAENVSGIDVDAAAPPDIVPPARQTDQSRRYEVFTAAAGYATTAQYGNTGALAAGAKATFRASFIPDFWRVTTFGTGASDYVMVDVDSYGGGGAMALCLPRSAQTYPARGYDITVVANAANTGPLTVTVEAFAGVKTEGD